jgi:MEMO1 family protein
MNASSQAGITDRQPVAAGRFYPADRETLKKDLEQIFASCAKKEEKANVRAIIAPHAGYVFSGKTAAAAFSAVPSNASFSNIFIIGSSHVMSFNGASVYDKGDFITPLGRMTVNREIAGKLINGNKVFNNPVTAHMQEHSIEVLLPFIQYHFTKVPPIVPIIIGTDNEERIKEIAEALSSWFTPDNLFIISSDFSHYPSYSDAVAADRATAEAIVTGIPSFFLSAIELNSKKKIKGLVTSMCGWTSGLTLMYLAEGKPGLEYKLIDYTNSGDSKYGGKDEVVGYNAIILAEKPGEEAAFTFTDQEREQLFRIARNRIMERLENRKNTEHEKPVSDKLSEHMGAFVTLKINGELRGCIGRFVSSDPLYEVVEASAISSAFGDPRFSQLTKEEYQKTEFEITVLGPLKRIHDITEIILGRHGIYIKKDNYSGTMLPQVATENGWTREQFLGYTARDKTGIGWEGWKDAELYIYEGVVLEEKRREW